MFQQDGVEASSAHWAYHLCEFCLTRVIKYIVVIGKVKYGYPMICCTLLAHILEINSAIFLRSSAIGVISGMGL